MRTRSRRRPPSAKLSIEQRWRIEWTKHLYLNRSELLMERIDAAIEQAVASVRNGGG